MLAYSRPRIFSTRSLSSRPPIQMRDVFVQFEKSVLPMLLQLHARKAERMTFGSVSSEIEARAALA